MLLPEAATAATIVVRLDLGYGASERAGEQQLGGQLARVAQVKWRWHA